MKTQTQPRQYRMHHGRKLQWWTCHACGKDLGPVASQYRMRADFAYPLAYSGKGNEPLCFTCYKAQKESGK
jgi:hypothetical protein